jgi:serine/threonine-protein kinase
MGEVYRARDTKLKRDVALKILPDEFSHDADRVSRFQREAEVLASLNHPNIAAIYDFQEANSSRFLVLELVEGETLADRIARGSIPVEEALDIAKHICEAFEVAHEKGIVHRDLKPANVKITPEGKVKVLDFGLAKAVEAAPAKTASNSPTLLSAAGMSGGVVLGTAGYMSPEQAKGDSADHRGDIFSFGCVLYEMLTARQTFHADTVTETLAAILMREPDLNALPANLHPKIEELIRRCLAKNRKDRWHAVADVRLEIAAIMADPHGLSLPAHRNLARRPFWQRALLVIAALILAVTVTAAVVWNIRSSPSPGLMQFSHVLPQDQRFTNVGRHLIAMSPDGASIVYIANQQLFLRKLSERQARPISGTASGTAVTTPFFSPDGRSVGFFNDGKLKKIAITGGSAVVVCDSISNPYGATWALDDQIYFGQGPKGILRVSTNGGGKPETVVPVKPGEMAHGPQVLPGGDALLFTLASGSEAWDRAQIVVQSLKSGERHVLISGGSDARYVATGHIIYALGGRLLAILFDLRKLQVGVGSTPIVDDVMRAPGNQTGAADFSFSNNGYLAYIPATGDFADRTLALIDRAGIQKSLDIPPGSYNHPRISPSGKQLAVHKEDVNNSSQNAVFGGGDIWIYDLTGTTEPRRLTFTGQNSRPIWTRDGERIVFASERDGSNGLFSQRADTPGSAELLTKLEQNSGVLQPESWSPGGTLLFTVNPGGPSSIWMLSPGASQKPTPLIPTPSTVSTFSPDGRWVVYESNFSGRWEVYVQPFPLTGAMHQISSGGGHYPLWSPDGKQLFYANDDVGGTSQIISVDVQTQPTFAAVKTTPLPVKGILSNQARGGFDITPDGKYFVVLLPPSPGKAPIAQINITLNWFDQLKQRVPLQ